MNDTFTSQKDISSCKPSICLALVILGFSTVYLSVLTHLLHSALKMPKRPNDTEFFLPKLSKTVPFLASLPLH